MSRGGTEFVVDIGSHPGQVYYVGVKSERQVASEYDFLPIFTSTPFSQMQNGNQVVNGQLVPFNIPDGSPAHPGIAYTFALAIYPITVGQVVVNDTIMHQNFGDLIGTLNHNGVRNVLNNHDSLGNPPGPYSFTYDDSGSGNYPGSQKSDGPGSLRGFTGTQGIGPWMLEEADTSLTQTGSVVGYTLTLVPHKDASHGVNVTLQPGQSYEDYIDVPVGYTGFMVSATNLPPTISNPPMELFAEQIANVIPPLPPPTDTNEIGPALLNNGTPPGNSISVGPPLLPGRYWYRVYNPTGNLAVPAGTNNLYIIAIPTGFSASAISTVDYASSGPVPILDDAVTTNSITVTNTDIIQDFSVGLRVDHPRISDLVFHLISPDGTRHLLMENRGGNTTNGCGATILNNFFSPASASGGPTSSTNFIDTGETSGTLNISYNFFPIPDQMTVYYSANITPANLITNTGFISNAGQFNLTYGPGSSTFITVIMNQFGNTNPGTAWEYTAGGSQTNYLYLAFTEDTNLTTTPIKFAPPPFVPNTLPILPPIPSNIPIIDGPILNTNNGHYYYLLGNTNWTGSEVWAEALGGHLTTIRNATENAWVLNTFSQYNGNHDLWIGFHCPPEEDFTQSTNYIWADGEPVTYTNWNGVEPNQGYGADYYVYMYGLYFGINFQGQWNNLDDINTNTPEPPLNGVAEVVPETAGQNLYYQPEQDMSAINNQSALGTWTLEIQDDRAGATNNATLQSWQLGFTFANTNFIPTINVSYITLTNEVPYTNSTPIPSNGVVFYQVNVPLNADWATNRLLSADAPLNVWWSTNFPPTVGMANDFLGIANLASGSFLMGTNTTPDVLIPGTTYWLGVQNTNSFTVTNYAIEVDFHLVPGISGPFAFTQPAQAVTGAGAQLNGMATPNGLPATAWFQWGTSTAYGNQTPPVSVGTGSNVVYTESQISGLLTNVPYHFRLVVSNALAVVYGFDQILDEANPVVWGANYAGQAKVPFGLSNVVAIAGAYDHSLALKNNETAVAWGDNLYGEATVPAGLSNLVALAGGESYSLALQNNGTVAAWGSDIYPGAGETNVPAGLSNVVMIASGQYSSLALQSNGLVTAWGGNLFNPTNIPAGLINVVSIAGGSLHNLAIKNDGTVAAWGDNGAGQTNVPANLTNVVAIAAGSFHSLALKGDGTVVAWGYDSDGQTDVPTNLANVVAIAAGGYHSMALKNDGSVVAWGDDSAGQTSVPVGLTNFVAIAAGYLHSLALTPQSIASLANVVLNATNGVAQTNSILPGGITFYQINVPVNADVATNILLFTQNGPLNVWLGTNSPATNVFLFSGTNGSYTLSTTGSAPTNLVPGSTYYLGVQNTNSVTVTYGIEVDFHLLTPTNAPIVISGITATNINGNFGFLLTWFAPTDDLFQVQWTPSIGPPVAWNTFSNIISYTSLTPTNGIGFFEFFDDGSQTGGVFGPARFYRLVLLQPLNNGASQISSVPAGGIDYFFVNVPTNADIATNQLLFSTGPVNLLFNQNALPTGTNAGDHTLLAGVTSGISVLSDTSAPTNIVPGGTYWLGVQNTNGSAVTFSLEVNFHLTAANISISSITFTNQGATNGFLLQWFAPTGDVFQVQWTDILSPANWQFFSNFIYYTGPVTPTNGLFSFFDDGSQTPPGLPPARFYRIVLVGSIPSTHTNAVSISSITSTNIAGTNGFSLVWPAPTNYLFEVQWTTNLMPIITWSTFPNIIAYSTFVGPTNSLFDFFDDGSQGGLGPIKFYRLILLP